jgi:hypothetical protein
MYSPGHGRREEATAQDREQAIHHRVVRCHRQMGTRFGIAACSVTLGGVTGFSEWATMQEYIDTGAELSECRRYRYVLWRVWDGSLPKVMFVGLNPSTADETRDDPTIRRCVRFSREWRYGGVCMLNLFAYRATKPEELRKARDPVGPENDMILKEYARRAGMVVACWGNHGALYGRNQQVIGLLPRMLCFGTTARGEPRHPLYLSRDSVISMMPEG